VTAKDIIVVFKIQVRFVANGVEPDADGPKNLSLFFLSQPHIKKGNGKQTI
jgi:hypothetical protein